MIAMSITIIVILTVNTVILSGTIVSYSGVTKTAAKNATTDHNMSV